jgi:hypothetical protein
MQHGREGVQLHRAGVRVRQRQQHGLDHSPAREDEGREGQGVALAAHGLVRQQPDEGPRRLLRRARRRVVVARVRGLALRRRALRLRLCRRADRADDDLHRPPADHE